MNDTETKIEVVKLSDLKNFSKTGTIIVEPCDNPKCIYKHLPLMNENKISFYRDSYGMFGTSKSVSEITVSKIGNVYYNNHTIKINVILDKESSLNFQYDESSNNYGRHNFFITNYGNLMVKRDDISQSKFPVIKRHGEIGLNILGSFVGLKKWNTYRSSSYTVGYCVMSNFYNVPLDRSIITNEERNEILQQNFKELEGNFNDLSKAEGISKSLKIISEFFEAESNFSSKLAFYIATQHTKRTIDNVKFSVIFNKMFANVITQEQFSVKAKELSDILVNQDSWYYEDTYLRSIIDTVPEAREIKKASIKKKSTGAFNKIMDDLDFVKIDQNLYPLTYDAVHSGEIPLGTFFRKNGDSYFVYNDNWELWEEMLISHKDIAIQIATSCSGRTTYEKDIMSYFYFTLHELPEYLEQQTGKKWSGIPKLVNSSDELDPPKEGDTGTAKTRSALTPIVDNVNLTITVPYVSMRIGGYQTTYCYGLSYNVLKRGFTYKGNTVVKDIEKQLNGRDDYGLMFYTLTGTAQGRGYPTFLIIFERLDKDTKVHFHRTHPMRSKGGDYNPIHNWTIGCYKWMIGNVNFERIKAQQGDLAFVEIDKFPDSEITKVDSYDSHCFEELVEFTPYIKKEKQNILGYVNLTKDTKLSHTEHMNRLIPKGIYEIRQCKSWEANPKGIWSIRID